MRAILRELKQQVVDIAGAIQDVCKSNPPDPKRFAEKPPKWWHKKAERPEADTPKKKERRANAHEVFDSAMWLEVMAMSDEEWRVKYGNYSTIRWSNKYGALQCQRFKDRDEMLEWLETEQKEQKAWQTSEVDFDADIEQDLTRRECGELLAYVPRLDDFELAGKVKRMKAQGLTLKAISERTGKPYQTIKHYSSALGKGQN